MPEKILVTGGCGFIGSNFVRHMLKAYENVHIVNLDKLTYAGNKENLKDIWKDKRHKFIKGDICDTKQVSKAMKGCSAIVNFAAESHVDRSIKTPEQFVKTDIFGVHCLLGEAKNQGIEKFVQISTDEVYGSTENDSFTEQSPLEPSSPYSASKAGADLIAHSYFVTYNVPVIITRSSNNFGPYQYPEKIIPLFITNLLQNKKVPLYGDGKNVRDWLYVLDNCEAIDLILRNGKAGEIYNVGGGNEVRNIDLTYTLLRLTDRDESYIQHVPDRPGHDRRYSIATVKTQRELGWQPKHSFENALRETVEWYKQNAWWWKPLVRKK